MVLRKLLRAESLYYLSHWCYRKGWESMGHSLSALNKILNCCNINCKARIGPGLHISHAVGLVIGGGIKMGKDCKIYHNLTLGSNNGFCPVIGNKVTIYPHTIIAGNIIIPDNSIIPAKSTLITKRSRIWDNNNKKLVLRKLLKSG